MTGVMRELLECILAIVVAHPDVRIVTDVGTSMFSGWGTLKGYQYHPEDNAIELFFD